MDMWKVLVLGTVAVVVLLLPALIWRWASSDNDSQSVTARQYYPITVPPSGVWATSGGELRNAGPSQPGKDSASRQKDAGAQLAFLHGLHASRQGDYESALALFTQAINMDANAADAYVARGCVRLYDRNEHDLTVEDHTKAISLQPTLAAGYFHRADTHWDAGNNLTALSDCNSAINLAPRLAAAYELRSRVLEALGDSDGSRRDLAQATELGYREGDACYPWETDLWKFDDWSLSNEQLGISLWIPWYWTEFKSNQADTIFRIARFDGPNRFTAISCKHLELPTDVPQSELMKLDAADLGQLMLDGLVSGADTTLDATVLNMGTSLLGTLSAKWVDTDCLKPTGYAGLTRFYVVLHRNQCLVFRLTTKHDEKLFKIRIEECERLLAGLGLVPKS